RRPIRSSTFPVPASAPCCRTPMNGASPRPMARPKRELAGGGGGGGGEERRGGGVLGGGAKIGAGRSGGGGSGRGGGGGTSVSRRIARVMASAPASPPHVGPLSE